MVINKKGTLNIWPAISIKLRTPFCIRNYVLFIFTNLPAAKNNIEGKTF
jgi:hypothetical protein